MSGMENIELSCTCGAAEKTSPEADGCTFGAEMKLESPTESVCDDASVDAYTCGTAGEIGGAGECTCGRKKQRDERELRSLVNRLRRIEGQVRGVVGMVETDAYCTDVLMQVSAIQSALSAFSRQLLASHIGSCVVEDIKADREGCVEELIEVIGRFMK